MLPTVVVPIILVNLSARTISRIKRIWPETASLPKKNEEKITLYANSFFLCLNYGGRGNVGMLTKPRRLIEEIVYSMT